MVYQQFINYPNLSVFENIASPLRVTARRPAEIRARVGRIAELLRLTPLLERRPGELSGGQQQRTALARALVKDADLVLLDEPLANLDYKLREALRDELPRLFADRGCTVVYATTEPAEALLLGGHVATLHEGRVTQFGPGVDGLPRAGRPDHRARVLRPADQRRRGAASAAADIVLDDARALAGAAGAARAARRRDHRRAAPAPCAPGRRTPVFRCSGPVLICEISGSESVVHFDARRHHLGLAGARRAEPSGRRAGAPSRSMSSAACTSTPPARRLAA